MIREAPSEPSRKELFALIRAQAAEIAALKARIAELGHRTRNIRFGGAANKLLATLSTKGMIDLFAVTAGRAV